MIPTCIFIRIPPRGIRSMQESFNESALSSWGHCLSGRSLRWVNLNRGQPEDRRCGALRQHCLHWSAPSNVRTDGGLPLNRGFARQTPRRCPSNLKSWVPFFRHFKIRHQNIVAHLGKKINQRSRYPHPASCLGGTRQMETTQTYPGLVPSQSYYDTRRAASGLKGNLVEFRNGL
jgi:hypothetical protein